MRRPPWTKQNSERQNLTRTAFSVSARSQKSLRSGCFSSRLEKHIGPTRSRNTYQNWPRRKVQSHLDTFHGRMSHLVTLRDTFLEYLEIT